MGFHADNDQGETNTLTALVSSPPEPRRVSLRPAKLPPEDGHQQVETHVSAGDACDMDGKNNA